MLSIYSIIGNFELSVYCMKKWDKMIDVFLSRPVNELENLIIQIRFDSFFNFDRSRIN